MLTAQPVPNTPAFLDREEKIMYNLAGHIPIEAKQRGMMLAEEIPVFDADEMREIAAIILEIVDAKYGVRSCHVAPIQ